MFTTFTVRYKMFVVNTISVHSPSRTQRDPASSLGDESLPIPNYTIIRRDAAHRSQIGIGLYVQQSIAYSTKRRADLEIERVECMWVEVKLSASSAILVGYVYRNPAVTYA